MTPTPFYSGTLAHYDARLSHLAFTLSLVSGTLHIKIGGET